MSSLETPFFRETFQCLENQSFGFIQVFGFHAFEADGIHHLNHVCFNAAAGNIFAESGLDKRFAQRGGRGAQQDMVKQVEGKKRFQRRSARAATS